MSESVNKLQFIAEICIALPNDAYELFFEIQGKDATSKLEDIQDIISNFETAANIHMFTPLNIRPQQPFMRSLSNDVNEGCLTYKWEVQKIDLGAYRILVNLMNQSHFTHEPLSKIVLKTLTSGDDNLNLDRVLSGHFPDRIDPAPFPLNIDEDLDKNKEPIIRLKFSRNLTDEEFEQVENFLIVWKSIIILGGYVETVDEIRDLRMNPGETYMLRPTMLEDTNFEFIAPVASFNAVINMAAYLHNTLCPLEFLEIV